MLAANRAKTISTCGGDEALAFGMEWIRSTNTLINSFLKTSDGKYIGLGTKGSGTSADLAVFKFDDNRNVDWAYTYGGSNEEKSGIIQPTLDGGYLIAGVRKASRTIHPLTSGFSKSPRQETWSGSGPPEEPATIGDLHYRNGRWRIFRRGDDVVFWTGFHGYLAPQVRELRSYRMAKNDRCNIRGKSLICRHHSGWRLSRHLLYKLGHEFGDAHLFEISADGSMVWQKYTAGTGAKRRIPFFLPATAIIMS